MTPNQISKLPPPNIFKRLIHLAMMRVIPWKCWGWRATSRLMRLNYWANEREFFRLATRQEDNITQRRIGSK